MSEVATKQTAAQAHHAAIERHRKAGAGTAAARAEVAKLERERHELLDKAARAPASVTAANLATADAKLVKAKHQVELAAAFEAATQRSVYEAEITALEAEANAIRREAANALALVQQKGSMFAAALARARAELDAMRAAGDDLVVTGMAGATLNDRVAEAVARNPVLAAMPPNERPRVRPGPRFGPEWAGVSVELMERGGEDPLDSHRLLAGLPKP